ncbi:MAG: hypothetical protein JW778_03695 [Candidatus Altiarchaeota archaeon]|nr:hypothetical protein [Candidatus Altiarchaeota archaeon]
MGSNLDRRITVYHIGGNAMCFHGMKATTKDADLVFLSMKGVESFKRALLKSNFIENEIVSIDPEYKWTEPYGIFDEKIETPVTDRNYSPGLRVDLFYRFICGGFEFSKRMKSRSRFGFVSGENLRNMICVPEDVLVFKSITHRDRDIEDMNRILQFKPDIDVIQSELRNQLAGKKDLLESVRWSINQLKERFGVNVALL